jgi:hypothetical protein
MCIKSAHLVQTVFASAFVEKLPTSQEINIETKFWFHDLMGNVIVV